MQNTNRRCNISKLYINFILNIPYQLFHKVLDFECRRSCIYKLLWSSMEKMDRTKKQCIPGLIKMWVLIGQWPMHTKPMLPACSHVTSWGVFMLLCMSKSYLKVLCIPHGKGRMKFLRKNMKNVLINTKNNAVKIYREIKFT